jgi:hypothetical protein
LLIYSKVAGTRRTYEARKTYHFRIDPAHADCLRLLCGLNSRPAASVEEEIKDVEQRANAAYEANDLAKYFSFYASDFSQFLPEGRTDLAGYQRDWTAYIGEGKRVQKVDFRHAHSGRSEQRYSRGELPLCMYAQS